MIQQVLVNIKTVSVFLHSKYFLSVEVFFKGFIAPHHYYETEGVIRRRFKDCSPSAL